MIWKRDWGLIGRQVIAWMIMLLLYLVILTVVMVFLKGTMMYFLIGLVFVMAFVQYFFSDKLVQRSMKVMLVDEDEEPKLYAMVRRLSDEAGLPMPKVGIIQQSYGKHPQCICDRQKPEKSRGGSDAKDPVSPDR